jgi:hypothetical protein
VQHDSRRSAAISDEKGNRPEGRAAALGRPAHETGASGQGLSAAPLS